jgi:predicted anti-sigma-YlaC factor YlaD
MMNKLNIQTEFLAYLCFVVFICVFPAGCSIRQMAIDEMSDALAAGGDVYATDDDPELIKAASPFSLKLMESMLAENPEHRGLLLSLARGFTQYSYAFVEQEADEIEDEDYLVAEAIRNRARRLYLRARDYGLRGLEVDHPGLGEELHSDPEELLGRIRIDDLGFLYWTSVSWAAAIALSGDDPDLIGDLPVVESLIDRALELDESYGDGAIHSFLITYEMNRSGGEGDPEERSRRHFSRAVELSSGGQAAPFVTLAEAVSIPNQDREEFYSLLKLALAIDPDERPEWRLANLIYQRRARWLMDREEDLFLETGNGN